MRREVIKPRQQEYAEKKYQLVVEPVDINGVHAVRVRLEHDDEQVHQGVSVIETLSDGTHKYRGEESWTNGDCEVFTPDKGLLVAVTIITGIFDQVEINLQQLGQEQQ